MVNGQQFGWWLGHAAMWSGTGASFVDLHPTGAFDSAVTAAAIGRQGGNQRIVDLYPRATLWSGSAASAVMIHPPATKGSDLWAMTETHQGGQVWIDQPTPLPDLLHAALWNGTAGSFVDMNPPGHSDSIIRGMHGNHQVGWTHPPTTNFHAAMWTGTPESYRDMHPFPGGLSLMYATCGSAQVGYVNSNVIGAGVKAGIWFGTPQSFMNLHQFLPPGYESSVATCVEERNGTFTVGGYARWEGTDHAFVWTGVPAPSSVMALVAAGLIAARRRRG